MSKFKIYVRPNGKVRVKQKVKKPKPKNPSAKVKKPKPKNPSAVAFVLRHITGRTCAEQRSEANRLLGVVEHTAADRLAIEQIIKSRCRKLQ